MMLHYFFIINSFCFDVKLLIHSTVLFKVKGLAAMTLPLPLIILSVIVIMISTDFPGAHLVSSSLQNAMELLSAPPLSDKIEGVFILGGAEVYKVCMCV